jgi:predicted glycoside hydrolase/deacetylase ChbG (UPF0249 family)
MLIVNADDLGRQKTATDNILACHANGRLTSTSAMVFMEDSERAADLARCSGIDTGLHINFSEAFTGPSVPLGLRRSHERIRGFLRFNRYAPLVFNPFLCMHFKSVYEAQYAEFLRLYHRPPSHLDGHQHMHLATNILFQRILPKGMKVRRSFSFRTGEKSFVNRWYRAAVDRQLSRRHRVTDYFFSITHHFQPERLARVIELAGTANVELMTHPAILKEYNYLMAEEYARAISRIHLVSYEKL